MVKHIMMMVMMVIGMGFLSPPPTGDAQVPPLPHRPCIAAPPMQLEVGQQAIVQRNLGESLNLRTEPYNGAPVLLQLPPQTLLDVIDGPLCGRGNNLFAWWQVRTEDGTVGWVAEGDAFRSAAQYFVAPLDRSDIPPEGEGCIAAPPSILYVGVYAQPNEQAGADLVLRAQPGGERLGYVLFDDLFKVIGGPRCGQFDQTFKWWQVQTSQGEVGWIAEGDATQTPILYFVRVVTPTSEQERDFRTAVETGCAAAPPTILQAGDEVVVTDTGGFPLSLRMNPGGAQIGNLPEGTRLTILDGFQCGSLYAWWQVSLADERVGWVAEGDATQRPIRYFIELYEEPSMDELEAQAIAQATATAQAAQAAAPPDQPAPTTPQATADLTVPSAEGDPVAAAADQSACQASPTQRLLVGNPAVVTAENAGGIGLHPTPSILSEPLVTLTPGMYMIVLNGPRCGDGNRLYTWWQVRAEDGSIGWVQEGDSAQARDVYYVQPVTD